MPGEAADNLEWPIRAYVEPIRSVLFVDDQFPTYGQPDTGEEPERARALWSACRDRGWLCDVDNAIDWSTDEQRKRLACSDLIVLDYQLLGDDPTPALKVIEQLAEADAPNLVVVYTAAGNLDSVLLRLASFARGVSTELTTKDLHDDVADMEGQIEWTTEALRAQLNGKDGWRRQFVAACKAQSVEPNNLTEDGRALIERAVKATYHAPVIDQIRPIEAIELEGDRRWFQCGNLFVAVVGKPATPDPAIEADTLFNGLTNSIQAWNPSWLACLIALSRKDGNQGAFRDDLLLPNKHLQDGLVRYMASADDDEEKLRRSRYVASDLLRRRFDDATAAMGAALLKSLPETVTGALDTNALLHLNAFLCSQRHDRHHLRTGTVFRTEDGAHPEDGAHYWVCVTPACDMVPRPRKATVDPWGASLGEARALMAVRLDLNVNNQTAVTGAVDGRYIFFDDHSEFPPAPRAAVVFNLSTNDPNPKVEQMFAKNLARVEGGKVVMQRIAADEAGVLSLHEQPCVVVSQLRAPYAERLTHIVGGHVSRIGVDFLSPSNEDNA